MSGATLCIPTSEAAYTKMAWVITLERKLHRRAAGLPVIFSRPHHGAAYVARRSRADVD